VGQPQEIAVVEPFPLSVLRHHPAYGYRIGAPAGVPLDDASAVRAPPARARGFLLTVPDEHEQVGGDAADVLEGQVRRLFGCRVIRTSAHGEGEDGGVLSRGAAFQADVPDELHHLLTATLRYQPVYIT